MARCDRPGAWDFIKVGGLYQYKEDGLILIVEILEDNSTEEEYDFKIRPIAGYESFSHDFDISFSKSFTGTFNGQSQFYEKQEYIMLPMGTPWPYIYYAEKLKKYELQQEEQSEN